MKDKAFPLITLGSLTFLLIVVFSLSHFIPSEKKSIITQAKPVFPKVSLEAKSAYVYDLRTGEVLFSRDSDKLLPLASLTKLMAALVASELSPASQTVTVTSAALATYGDSGLQIQEKWSLKNLLDFSLLTSSNDGIRAVALALVALGRLDNSENLEASFVQSMNDKATKLGLKRTYFWNETGLDESAAKGGAYGTAEDLTTLMAYIILKEPSLLEATKEAELLVPSLDQTLHHAKNTNLLVREIPGLLASKTGFTEMAGGNLVFVFDPELGRPIVVTVLGSSPQGRFEDARKLIAGTLTYLKNN